MICSECFKDQGLKLEAEKLGKQDNSRCSYCNKKAGFKLSMENMLLLCEIYFRDGCIVKCKYGFYPYLQFNDLRNDRSYDFFNSNLQHDANLISDNTGIVFFEYGPRYWMFGQNEPLKELQSIFSRKKTIKKIISTYPTIEIKPNQLFYRLRKYPKSPHLSSEYDSPPKKIKNLRRKLNGRFDSYSLPIFYASENLDICIHECRTTIEDELYLATLSNKKQLKILNLSHHLKEEDVTEFESIDIAINMLFLAGEHSYPITRELARIARTMGFDGIYYPSYFSLTHSGHPPLETVLGISIRRIPQFKSVIEMQTIPNIAIFGCPIKEGSLTVKSINKLSLRQVNYNWNLGPVIE